MNIDDILKLDGKTFAMLSPAEYEVFKYYRSQGRKFGVEVTIANGADQKLLVQANSLDQIDEIERRTNGVVSVHAE